MQIKCFLLVIFVLNDLKWKINLVEVVPKESKDPSTDWDTISIPIRWQSLFLIYKLTTLGIPRNFA